MKVRVKQGCQGFYGIKVRREGEIFELEERFHGKNKDAKGNPVKITVEQQFSDNWMEKVDKPAKRKRKALSVSDVTLPAEEAVPEE